MKKVTFGQKFRYKFDNTMSKGAGALMMWLGIITLIIILIATAIILFGVNPQGEDGTAQPLGVFDALWESLMRSMDAGTVAGDKGWPYRILMLLVTLSGIFILSTLIGILSNGITEKLEELRRGKSFVVENDHTLILGWNSKVFTIISELVIANENQKKPRIVILADEDKTVMEEEVRSKIESLKNTKVVCRNGNPNDMNDIAISNPQGSKSIIILSPESGEADPDAQTIKTILALTNSPERREEPYHIIAEIKNEKNQEIAKIVGKDEVELILTDDLISRIMVQTCRQSGLSIVYTELMDFDGAEIYFNDENKLVGRNFGESLFLYKDSAVLGMQKADGTVMVNPPMDTVYEKGDKVIAITEDDDTLILGTESDVKIDESAIVNRNVNDAKPENTLILGWNLRGKAIIREMNNYVQPGSIMRIISHYDEAKEDLEKLAGTTPNLKLEYINGETTDRKLLDSIDMEKYDHIIVLSYIGHMDIQAADAQTLITLLHLRDIAEIKNVDLSIVSEMMDIKNRELASVTNADDFVVSDKMISLLMSQVSENKDLMRVFEDVFDSDGSEIYLKPITNYIDVSKPVNFYTLIESARRKGEIAIGYRIVEKQFDKDSAYGVKINPVKPDMIQFTEEDKIIVFAED